MSSSYRRVSQRENPTDAQRSDSLEASVTRSRLERLTDKVAAIAWVILAIVVAQWTSFFSVLWKSEMANRTLLRIAAMGAGIVTSLIVYLVVYLPKVKGLTDSSAWSVYCPKVIPTMTATSILTYLIALRGTWPVWGFLSPLIFGIQLMGGLMVLHFVPAGNWC